MSVKSLYFSSQGRLARSKYFTSPILLTAVLIIVQIIAALAVPVALPVLQAIIFIVIVLASLFLAAKRWHDLGKSGWMSILILIPIVNFFVGLYLLFAKGNEGENKYGATAEYASKGLIAFAVLIMLLPLLAILLLGGSAALLFQGMATSMPAA